MAEGTAEAGMDRRVEPEAELGEATSPAVARDLFRGGVVRPTCGISKGYAQANMIAPPPRKKWRNKTRTVTSMAEKYLADATTISTMANTEVDGLYTRELSVARS